MVSEDCLIQFDNLHKPLFIECDASKQGIGVNNGIPSNLWPVAYASKGLSEQNYANIERELLCVVSTLKPLNISPQADKQT